MENKRLHLELIQAVVSRMAGNSFLLKGWSVLIVSALFALAAKDSQALFICLASFPAVAFWILDAYFLRQERLFRRLYDRVRVVAESDVDFSMDTSPWRDDVRGWFATMFSQTLLIFHGVVVGSIVLVTFVVLCTRR